MKPQVTVVVSAYNNPRLVQEAVGSVLAQTFQPWECLVFDDGSERLPDLPSDPRVRLFALSELELAERRSRVRYAVINNLGLWMARGELISYLAHDDLFLPDRLERMVGFFDRRPEVTTVFGHQLLYQWADHRWLPLGVRPTPPATDSPAGVVDHSSIMHRTAAGIAAGGWPDRAGEQLPSLGELWSNADAHYWERLVRTGGTFWRVPGGPTDIHRFHPFGVQALEKSGRFDLVGDERVYARVPDHEGSCHDRPSRSISSSAARGPHEPGS